MKLLVFCFFVSVMVFASTLVNYDKNDACIKNDTILETPMELENWMIELKYWGIN